MEQKEQTGKASRTAEAETDNEARRWDLKKHVTKAMRREIRRQKNRAATRAFYAPYLEAI